MAASKRNRNIKEVFMAQKVMIDGTLYELKPPPVLIDGTKYQIGAER